MFMITIYLVLYLLLGVLVYAALRGSKTMNKFAKSYPFITFMTYPVVLIGYIVREFCRLADDIVIHKGDVL